LVERIILEINNRLQFLIDVGLGYLTLNRAAATLSGGESQRINLATSLGSSLVGSLYILDEPSIGLHPRDTYRLVKVLKQLRDQQNTVIVVEHEEEIIRAADYIIDIGPGAGMYGGEVVFKGTLNQLLDCSTSNTADYLTGRKKVQSVQGMHQWNSFILIEGARQHNLKNLHVKIPIGISTVITGVSGSGKTTLIKNILYPALKKRFGAFSERTGEHTRISGDLHLIHDVDYVDQNPIGKSSRSNPATYIKAWDEVRKLFSSQKQAIHNGFKASHFSFNVDGGRCEECQGEGEIRVEMQFMADVFLKCEACDGKRFKDDVLEVKYNGKNVSDFLEMTIDEAVHFLESEKGSTEKRIVKLLSHYQDVGLSYLRLGQSSNTLSGGESQRIKLASFLSNEKSAPTVFIFDEPTTGLHFHDISNLQKAFDKLREQGHTLIIIEHNAEIIKNADWVIDLGPEGGEKGGSIVFEGTPKQLVKCKKSYTGQFLKGKLN
jgi:excinuclease ABC subunit A